MVLDLKHLIHAYLSLIRHYIKPLYCLFAIFTIANIQKYLEPTKLVIHIREHFQESPACSESMHHASPYGVLSR